MHDDPVNTGGISLNSDNIAFLCSEVSKSSVLISLKLFLIFGNWSEIQVTFVPQIEMTPLTSIIKFLWDHRRPWRAKAILNSKKKKNLVSDFKTCYNAIGKKPAWDQHEVRHLAQWNRKHRNNPFIFSQVTFVGPAKIDIRKKIALFGK